MAYFVTRFIVAVAIDVNIIVFRKLFCNVFVCWLFVPLDKYMCTYTYIVFILDNSSVVFMDLWLDDKHKDLRFKDKDKDL